MKNRKKLLVHFIICLIAVLLVCMPLANGSNAMGSDNSLHIDRIEALYQAMEAGQLYPKIFWESELRLGIWLHPLFYSDFFLIILAWFRHLGMGILPSYRLFLFLLFFCMACTMCHLASDVIHMDYLSTASAVLIYVFSSHLFFPQSITVARHRRGTGSRVCAAGTACHVGNILEKLVPRQMPLS